MQESIVCLSHVRWSVPHERARQLMTRCAREHDVVFFEEPLLDAADPELELLETDEGVTVAIPHLAPDTPPDVSAAALRRMIDRVTGLMPSPRPVLWYCTPRPLAFTHHVKVRAVIYDCVEESEIRVASEEWTRRDALLMTHADVVFTCCHSLCEHKRAITQHKNIHPFLSSVDIARFVEARDVLPEPPDLAPVGRPRIGFFGPIVEYVDLQLLAELADARPELQLVMIGPASSQALPQRMNIHWLGARSLDELPAYLAGWDVAMLPYARNEATRVLSPTKILEFLAAGLPVVSTPIPDVIRPFGREGLAWIADGARELADSIDDALASCRDARLAHADAFLADTSWDRTYEAMWTHVERAIAARASVRTSGLHATGAAAARLALAKLEG